MLIRAIFFGALVSLFAFGWGAAASGASPFADEPEPLQELQPRSEAAQDRVAAAALYAHGRVLYQRREYAKALRRYQRAWRYDRDLVPLFSEVIGLAFSLKRDEEAKRYAVLAVESDPKDADLLEELAGFLIRQDQLPRAIQFFERAFELRKENPNNAAFVGLCVKLGRLCDLTDRNDQAARYFVGVLKAVEQPEKYQLSASQLKRLTDPAAVTFQAMGDCLLEAGDLDHASDAFRRAGQSPENPGMLALGRARIAAAKRQYAKARAALNEFLKGPQADAGVVPYELLAQLLRQEHDDADAAGEALHKELERLHASHADCVPLGLFLARLALEAGDLAQAEAICRPLAEESDDARSVLVDIYFRQRNAEKLLAALGQFAAQERPLPLVEKVAGEPELLDQLLALAGDQQAEPDDKGRLLAAASLAMQGEKFAAADKLFAAAAAADPQSRVDVLTTWGLAMMMADQQDRSAKALEEAVQADRTGKRADQLYLYLAAVLALDEQTADAVKAAKRAAALKPDSAYHQSRLPWVLYNTGELDEAEKRYLALLERFDANTGTADQRRIIREARMVLSNICLQQDRYDEAVEWLEQVLDEYPEDIGALNDLGYLWADHAEHLERALRMTRHAVKQSPENKAYRDSLGWAYYQLEKYNEAVKQLELAADDEEADGVILDHLGDAYWKLKQRPQAIKAWRRAVDAFDKQEEEQRIEATRDKIRKAEKEQN